MARYIFTPEDTRKSHEVRVYHPLSEETKRKISESHRGVKLSEEHRQKQSEARLRHYDEHPEFKFQCTRHFKGKKRPEEARKKGGEGRSKYLWEHPEVRHAMAVRMSENREIGRISNKGVPKSLEHRNKISLAHKGRSPYSLTRSATDKRLWQNPEYVARMMEARKAKPNKKEKELFDILSKLYPGQFKYNGDCSLGVILNRCIPDFVNVNGKKQVIELFGKYWHTLPGRGEKDRVERYEEIGWDCLVIWDDEFKDIEVLEGKIKAFVGGDSNR